VLYRTASGGTRRRLVKEKNEMATLVNNGTRIGTSVYAQKARWARVRIETEGAVYVGHLYVPETKKRLSDVLCDERPFLNMRDVTINDSTFVEPFVALNKSFVKCVRVLQEEEAVAVPFRR
jgi:hypothetical protein